MSLSGRLNRLESAPASPGGCPVCGDDPNAPVCYEVIWPEDDEATEDPVVSAPACPRCGYRERTVLSWDDIVTDPEQVRAERERMRELEERRREYLESRPDLTAEQVPDYPPSEDGWGGGSSL